MSISEKLRRQVITQANYRCEYCQTSSRLTGAPLVMEHILPRVLGGTCDAHTGKKELQDRVHACPECGYTTHRDVAAAQIVRNRGLSGVGRILDNKENACGDDLTGTGNRLVKSRRDRNKS